MLQMYITPKLLQLSKLGPTCPLGSSSTGLISASMSDRDPALKKSRSSAVNFLNSSTNAWLYWPAKFNFDDR